MAITTGIVGTLLFQGDATPNAFVRIQSITLDPNLQFDDANQGTYLVKLAYWASKDKFDNGYGAILTNDIWSEFKIPYVPNADPLESALAYLLQFIPDGVRV